MKLIKFINQTNRKLKQELCYADITAINRGLKTNVEFRLLFKSIGEAFAINWIVTNVDLT